MSRCHHGPHCGCRERIVYPVRHNVVNHRSVNTVEHIHPSHTTHVNHHLTRNVHLFPHSDSFRNTFNSVNVYGGSFQVPNRRPLGCGPGGCGPRPFRPF